MNGLFSHAIEPFTRGFGASARAVMALAQTVEPFTRTAWVFTRGIIPFTRTFIPCAQVLIPFARMEKPIAQMLNDRVLRRISHFTGKIFSESLWRIIRRLIRPGYLTPPKPRRLLSHKRPPNRQAPRNHLNPAAAPGVIPNPHQNGIA